jgi:hypothetical protein
VNLDRPTVQTLGVQVLISGDEDRDARISVRYGVEGSAEWREGPPLFRVLPKTTAVSAPEQFAGASSISSPGPPSNSSSSPPSRLVRIELLADTS